SVGIQAKGRTTILRLNYRNTREILSFASSFAKHYFNPQSSDDDHIPLIEPEAGGKSGPAPQIRKLENFNEEINYTIKCLKKWHAEGIRWGDIAVLYQSSWQGRQLACQFNSNNISHLLMDSKKHKEAYDPADDQITLTTVHSSKGLEFSRVIIVGIGQMSDDEARQQSAARLLYVGMTRAQECLLLTTSKENEYSLRLMEVGAAA
ncbi:MAG TPA: DNA helicase II, partial [Candidatus Tenderia sp.]|nr:DNA helicase II [Candidatus Tenderia sp.]